MHGEELAVTSEGPWQGRSELFLRTREETRSCLHWFPKLETAACVRITWKK